jgi:isopenicillin N synthase-like dioxygenase
MEELPVVDVAAVVERLGERAVAPEEVATGAAIDAACRELGFFLVRGHGIDLSLLAALDGAARAFFAQPDARKA